MPLCPRVACGNCQWFKSSCHIPPYKVLNLKFLKGQHALVSFKLHICIRLIILLTDPILSHSPNFGRPKQGQKFVVPTFHIHILNPECVRIPWVLAPKNFPVQNFRVRSVLQKSSIFHWFLLPPPKKKYRARVPTILMPETFPIASLNRYTQNFSGAS